MYSTLTKQHGSLVRINDSSHDLCHGNVVPIALSRFTFSLVSWYHSPTTVNYRTPPTPLHFCFDTIALIGLLGSITLLIGAMVGVVGNRWITLLPGTVLLLIALASLFEPYLWAAVIMVVVLPLLLNVPHDSFEDECHGSKMPC